MTSVTGSLSGAARYWSRSGWVIMRLIAAGAPAGTSAARGQAMSSRVEVCAVPVRVRTRLLPGRISAGRSLSWAVKCWSLSTWEVKCLIAAGAPAATSAARCRIAFSAVRASAGCVRAAAGSLPAHTRLLRGMPSTGESLSWVVRYLSKSGLAVIRPIAADVLTGTSADRTHQPSGGATEFAVRVRAETRLLRGMPSTGESLSWVVRY
jgi:hypothetical protein